MKKIFLITLISVIIILFFLTDAREYLSFEYLKTSKEIINLQISESYYLYSFLFFLSYILVTALSLPGAAIMTLAAGVFFGLLYGTIIVSFASTIGASLAFLTSRFLIKDWVTNKFHSKITQINNGIKSEGAMYLFTLRLIPAIPFFVINLALGVTAMRLITFAWVSQLGMLPGTLIYVNAGTQISQINNISEIMSVSLIASLIMIALLPLILKKLIVSFKSKKNEKISNS